MKRIMLIAMVSMLNAQLNAMQAYRDAATEQHALQEDNVKAITQWPDYLYGEAFPGASFPKPISKEELRSYQERAFTMTLEEARSSKLDETRCVELDWVFALMESQKKLMRKPLEEWTVQDICDLSSWITRLTAKNPGKFRQEPVLWNLKELTPAEEAKLARIESKSKELLSDDEIAFLNAYFYQFIHHADIEKALQDTLTFIRSELKAVLDLPVKDRSHRYLGIGSAAHFEIVRIHPFEEGAKRLGRIMMYIIWAQRGLEPVTFFDLSYTESLMAALTKSHSIFLNYIAKQYYFYKVLRGCPSYHQILNDILGKPNGEKGDLKTEIYNHPLFQAYMREKNSLSDSERKTKANFSPMNSNERCQFCQKAPAPLERFQKCGRCKSVVYCSKTCQAADWSKSHKQQCVKK